MCLIWHVVGVKDGARHDISRVPVGRPDRRMAGGRATNTGPRQRPSRTTPSILPRVLLAAIFHEARHFRFERAQTIVKVNYAQT